MSLREPGGRGARWLALGRQLTTFGFVSIATTGIDFLLFNAFILTNLLQPVVANTISYSTGIVASDLLNKRFTFRGGGRDKRSHEFGLFVAINLGALALNSLSVGLASEAGASTPMLNLVKLAAGVATWVLKFVLFKRWVYPMQAVPDEGTQAIDETQGGEPWGR